MQAGCSCFNFTYVVFFALMSTNWLRVKQLTNPSRSDGVKVHASCGRPLRNKFRHIDRAFISGHF